jgi:hypothetical protein
MPDSTTELYDTDFYAAQSNESLRSAQKVAPFILELLDVRSVVDIGGGVGPWVRAFLDAGVQRGLCIDGDYVDRSALLIPQDRFLARNLTQPLGVEERFDLAISVEVAEHLPPAGSHAFVKELVRLAPVVLFSAAIPLQGGVDHQNERWQSYWQGLFEQEGYRAIDVVRPQVWNDPDVTPFYAQNALLYASADAQFRREPTPPTGWPLDLVNPRFFEYQRSFIDNPPVRQAAQTLGTALLTSAKTRAQRLLESRGG